MTVSVKDGKIESFSAVKGCPGNLAAIGKLLPGMEVTKVIKMAETKRIAEPAIEKLTAEIIAKQSVEVDSVAGATYTSEGFKEAIADALKK
jgi:uncharacterized protein with FMN-binding domain